MVSEGKGWVPALCHAPTISITTITLLNFNPALNKDRSSVISHQSSVSVIRIISDQKLPRRANTMTSVCVCVGSVSLVRVPKGEKWVSELCHAPTKSVTTIAPRRANTMTMACVCRQCESCQLSVGDG